MNKLMIIASIFLANGLSFAQEERIVIEINSSNLKITTIEGPDTVDVELNIDELSEASLAVCDDFDEDTPRLKTGISNRANWSGLDVGVSMLFTPDWQSGFSDTPHLDFDPAKSWTINFNFFEHYFAIAGSHFGLVTGLGVNWSHFGYRRNYTINYDADSINGFVDPNRNYSKNRIRAAYLQIPLLLQVNLGGRNGDNFHLSFGAVGGVRIGSQLKQKFMENNSSFKIKERRGQYFFNPFKLDATARLGYGDWGAFASYNLIPLFDQSVVSPVHNLSFGLMFNF